MYDDKYFYDQRPFEFVCFCDNQFVEIRICKNRSFFLVFSKQYEQQSSNGQLVGLNHI